MALFLMLLALKPQAQDKQNLPTLKSQVISRQYLVIKPVFLQTSQCHGQGALVPGWLLLVLSSVHR